MTTVQELRCFGAVPGGGNPALVIQDDQRDAEQRQQFAHQRNKPACVFIDRAPGGAIVLDYFYPHTRSPLCLHATLAAARVLLSPGRPVLTVHTAMRGQALELLLHDGELYVGLDPQPVADTARAAAAAPGLAAGLLAAPAIALASAPAVASVGSPKLLLEVADSAALQALAPDLPAIADWGSRHGVSGVYAWCRRPDGALEGRNFNHLDPAAEDGATGVAAGALTVLLGQGLRLHQGANLGQPCLIRTQWRDGRIFIGGAAI
jgi:PhzF family phenazine biosynthesis protein